MQPTRLLVGHSRPVGALIQGPVAPGQGPSSPFLFSGGDDFTIRLWDMKSAVSVVTLTGHRSAVRALAASESDGTVWSGGSHGEIRQWQGQACTAILHPNRATMVKEGRYTYHLHDKEGQRYFNFCDSSVVGLAAGPEGELYSASKCGAVRRWVEGSDRFYESMEWDFNKTYPSGFRTCTLDEPGLTSMIHLANDPAHSGDGKLLVGCSSVIMGPILGQRLNTPYMAWELPEANGLTCNSYKPWWQCQNPYNPSTPPSCVSCFAGSSITEFYMGEASGNISKYEGRSIVATFSGHGACVRALGLSRDGATLFSGASDGTLKVWSTESGACLSTLEAHRGPVLALLVLQDGSGTVFSSGKEGVIKEWRFA